MDINTKIIDELFLKFNEIRYVAIYQNEQLRSKERSNSANSSSSTSDFYEELLVNPSLLTLTRQRGNIDCGGLRFILVAYGNFYQLIWELKNEHISICLDKGLDLKHIPEQVFKFFKKNYPALIWR